MEKSEVRALVRSMASSFSDEAAASERVWTRVEALEAFASASTILLYMSLPGEVDTVGFLGRWYGRKRFVIPLVRGKSLELREYHPEYLVIGYRGILEPSEKAALVAPSEIDLALVPGVAFSRDGMRLGHGGGFYDRLLPSLYCPKVGVCFSYRIVDSIPSDPWDVAVDAVVSD